MTFRARRIFFWVSIFLLSVLTTMGQAVDPAEAPKVNLSKEMVLFQAGEFWMGARDGIGQRDEHPAHRVYLDSYWLDKFEVSGKDFAEYLNANPNEHPTITGWIDREIRPDMADRPVFGLSWKRCFKYCLWRGKRLPSEAEWERAAAGMDRRLYPWGDEPPNETRANFNKCCFVRDGLILDPVDAHESGKTPEGVYQMAGNVAEWVFDWYDEKYYESGDQVNPLGPDRGKYHVVRGGAWNSLVNYMRSSDRYGYNDANDFYGVGCRCAKSASEKD